MIFLLLVYDYDLWRMWWCVCHKNSFSLKSRLSICNSLVIGQCCVKKCLELLVLNWGFLINRCPWVHPSPRKNRKCGCQASKLENCFAQVGGGELLGSSYAPVWNVNFSAGQQLVQHTCPLQKVGFLRDPIIPQEAGRQSFKRSAISLNPWGGNGWLKDLQQ